MSYHFHAEGILLPDDSRGDRKTQVGSKRHFTGGIVFGADHGTRLGTESHLEMKAALVLRYHPLTLDLVEQVRFEWCDEQGEFHNHFIDLVQTRSDGSVVGYAVRPHARVSQKYRCDLARIKEQAVAQCALDDLRLFTEEHVCPVALHNAKLFHSVRKLDPFAEPVMQDVLSSIKVTTTVGDLADQTGLGGMGFRVAVRLIYSGHLGMLRHERINRSTKVFKAHIN